MRLLILGHYSHTGFGTVTVNLGERFLAQGVDVRIIAVNHRGDPVRGPLAGRVWPAGMFGNDFGGNLTAPAIDGTLWPKLDPSDRWQPDALLVIADMTGLMEHMGQVDDKTIATWQSIPVYHYCPIEGDNLKPAWRAVWELVRPVAMSDYGQRVISAHIGRPVPRIYHGVDTEAYRPVTINDPAIVDGKRFGTKEACKAWFGLAGRKVIVRADRNVTRKFYGKLFEAFVPIAEADPDVSMLLHCSPQDVAGEDLIAESGRLPEWLVDAKRIWFTGAHDTFVGLTTDGMRALYSAADLYVSTTGGEGFGLTLAESLACETPVVVTDWAAEREVVGPGGIMVPPLHDSYGEPVRYRSTYGMDWATPDPRAFVEPVLSLLAKPSRRRALGAEGRRHVMRSFSWDTAAAEFLALFEEANAPAAVAV